jgi:hypothetical protein
VPDTFPDPGKPPSYPNALAPAFTVQDEQFDNNLVPPLTEEQVAQAREWNQLLANFVEIYNDIRTAIVALGLDPDLDDDLTTSFSLIASELAGKVNLLLSSDVGYTGDPNGGGAPAAITDAPAGTVFIDETGVVIWQRVTDAGSYVQVFPSVGISGVEVQEEDTPVVSVATILNFIGATVSDDGGGKATVTIEAASPEEVEEIVLGGTPTAVSAFAQWKKISVPFGSFTAAAAEESIVLLNLPGGTVIEAVKQKHVTAFSGPGITGYTLEVGFGADPAKYSSPFDVSQAVANGTQLHSGVLEGEDHASPWAITVTARATGANVNAATAGVAEIWVLCSSTIPTGAGDPEDVPVIAVGALLPVEARPKWVKTIIDFDDFTQIHAAKLKHVTPFSGGGLSAYTLEVGVTGDLSKYTQPFNVFQAVGDTVMQHSQSFDGENHGLNTNILLTARSSGADTGDGTAGQVELWLKVSGPLT